MSVYSGGQIKTEHIDPVIDLVNNRSEFRLDNYDVVMSNMRLANVGLNGTSAFYNPLLGSYSTIKRISLLNGQTELSVSRNANLWLGFQNVLNPNSVNESLGQPLKNNSVGYYLKADDDTTGNIRTSFSGIEPIGDEDENGHLDLRTIMPLLGEISSLNNVLFPQLKIVIEWETDDRVMVVDKTANDYTTLSPLLIVDVAQDEGVRNNAIKNFPSQTIWNEIEHDEFIIPAVGVSGGTTHADQNSSFKINGFNNKSLGRLCIMKQDSNPANLMTGEVINGIGNVGSLAMNNEKINLVVNGRNLLSGEGLETNAQRTAMLCDTWGSVNIVPNGNLDGGRTNDTLLADEATSGQTDYVGIYVGDNINDLQLNYRRSGIYNNGTQHSTINELRVHVFGETSKVLSVKNGMFNVAYV
tara:strand:- start:2663 stop:3901 length:1239 start_codon:yes stop_codon:yes gene_type:complete